MVKMERGRPCCDVRGVFQLHICSLLSIVRLSHSPGTRPAVRATASCVTSAEDSGTSTRYAYALRTSGVCKITDDKTNKTPDQQWGPRRMLLDPLKQKGVGAYQFVTRGLGWDRCGCQSSFPALQTNLESRRRNDVKRPESLIFRCNKWRIVQSIQELDSDADFAFASSCFVCVCVCVCFCVCVFFGGGFQILLLSCPPFSIIFMKKQTNNQNML